ncbi:uncharacterized protein [Atheta coriaria]|uniref:uncharacterized protein isoform X2 n=1 Tax=Dalotia coriaria TaxID=877792 RepID=UPI0031F3F8D7
MQKCVILGSYVHDITENRDALDEMVFHVPMRYIHIAEVDILAGYHMLIEIPILMDLSDGIFGLNREVGFTHCCVLRWIVAYDRAELYELEPIELQFEPECAFH